MDVMRKRNKDEEPIDTNMEQANQPGAEFEPESEFEAPDVDELQSEIERLRVELEEQKKRTQEEHDQHLRALADFSNYKRRHQDDYKEAARFAGQEMILKILPALDNFERALQAADQTKSFESLVEGIKLTLKQVKDILEREGVQTIQAVGQEFDPMLHEAVMRFETDEYPENTVVEEFQTGYTHHGKVIRPSRVKVAALPE